MRPAYEAAIIEIIESTTGLALLWQILSSAGLNEAALAAAEEPSR
jgi:hypothetical protein